VKEIAGLVAIDADLVARCVRNLHFYGCVTMVPIFLYANTYVSTEALHQFYADREAQKVGEEGEGRRWYRACWLRYDLCSSDSGLSGVYSLEKEK
jgi:hypothetical protein